MQPDDLPFRAMRELCVVLDGEMDRRIDTRLEGHVDEWHRVIPGPRTERLTAVPWPDERIPDEVLARIVEVLESQGGELAAVAAAFGLPTSLVERELAQYKGAHRKYVLALANA